MASVTGEDSKKLKLYSDWGSSCSCRVRIALKLKGLDYEYIAIDLLKGDQKSPEFLKINPLGYVPVLVDGDIVVADSFAIILVNSFVDYNNIEFINREFDIIQPSDQIILLMTRDLMVQYLEEKYPQHPLLPKDLQKRALNYQAANLVSSNIQPLQNLFVLEYIQEKLGADEEVVWALTHIRKGFAALEKLLENYAGKYATGNEVFLADLFLAPQIEGGVRRFNVDMNEFPLLSRIYEAYKELPAFEDAMPQRQPDAPPEARA